MIEDYLKLRWYAILRHKDGGSVKDGPYETEKEAKRALKEWLKRKSADPSSYVWYNSGIVNV